jgi:putative hydrolase of the HAD superfamily
VRVPELEIVHDSAHEQYVGSWSAGRQFRVQEAVEHMLEGLDVDFDTEIAQVLVEGFYEAGRRATIRPSEGVRKCLQELKGAGVRIGIICDIGLTPSPVLCELLERHRLGHFFDGMAFSDDVGHYKPASAIFEHALSLLGGVHPECSVHVGDRRRTDVAGAIAMGMTAVRYNGIYEDDATRQPEADIVIGNLAALPPLLGIDATS